jgi:succinyl-diaminopimelate desuccinylase
MNDVQKVLEKIDSSKNDMIDMQKAMISLEAVSPVDGGSGEAKKAEYLKTELEKFCDEVKVFNAPHKEAPNGVRPNLVGILKGKDASKTLWFMSHMDVVRAGDEKLWNTPPFEGVVKDGKVYGRGAEDNQQGLASSFFAAKVIRELGITPAMNIGLLFVADEERGSGYRLKYLLAEHLNMFGKDDQFIVTDAGSLDGSFVEIAEKGIFRIKATIEGKSSHACWPQKGVNANRAMAYFTVKFDNLKNKYNEQNKFFDYPFSSFEPTQRFSNDVSFNTIPGKEVQMFDFRIIPPYKGKDVLKDIETVAHEIEKDFGVKVTLDTLVADDPAPVTSAESRSVVVLKKAIKDEYKIEPNAGGIGGGTVARFLRHAGFNVVVWSKIEEALHNPNEYCVIDNMVGDSKVYARVALTI